MTTITNDTLWQRLTDEGSEGMSPATRAFWQVHTIVFYYMVLLLITFWFLVDTWSRNFAVGRWLGLSAEALADPLFRTMGFMVIGSVFGCILFQTRTLFRFYLKEKSYDYRWLGKYFSAPLESAAMALIVFALLRGGVVLLGNSTGSSASGLSNYSVFGIGALVGFGMRDVVGWLGELVRVMFKTGDNGKSNDSKPKEANTPA